MFLGSTPMQGAAQPQSGPDSAWGTLSPQQKMALALMQSNQNPQVNQQGQESSLQGLSQIANAMMAAQLMKQGNNPLQQPAVKQVIASPYAGADTQTPQA